MRKMVNIDTAALKALELLAADRKMGLQDLVDEALADLLKKHRRPVTTKEIGHRKPQRNSPEAKSRVIRARNDPFKRVSFLIRWP